ncbi:MAG: proline dehydrogenase family protein [Acidobacteriota bacterium]|nr:proline dehydrogenase family protein [Acidobacteriota bacterium]
MNVIRALLLKGSESRWLREHGVKYAFVRRAVSRFMPGETLDDALAASRSLGVPTVLTHLGENLNSADEAEAVTRHYLDALERVRASGLDVEVSVKLTQLGLDFSRDLCEKNLLTLVERARSHGKWLWVDIESTAYTDATLEVYRRARSASANVGLCLQAYLYRTAADMQSLVASGTGIRLVKGAYREPPDKAFPKKEDVDENYFRLAEKLLSPDTRANGVRAIFGTHDPALIRRLESLAKSAGLAPADVEFQMLYGIRRQEQLRLAADGYRFRVLISYGAAWFPWYMRRLAERPANVLFVLKNLFAR